MWGAVQQIRDLSFTPGIAWLNSAMLLATPVLSPAQPSAAAVAQQAGGWLARVARPKHIGPTTKTSLLFGAAQALGGWIIHDGDLESGSGFLAAWSALYLVVGGRGSLRALRYGRLWPLVLATTSGLSGLAYGERFLSGRFLA
ncbi:AaceriADL203Cp [[Ashbya] aceris (nom. inval.)]|nr:AaceriADL203Cp [[Ashbya] aceris (nom. inval.)]